MLGSGEMTDRAAKFTPLAEKGVATAHHRPYFDVGKNEPPLLFVLFLFLGGWHRPPNEDEWHGHRKNWKKGQLYANCLRNQNNQAQKKISQHAFVTSSLCFLPKFNCECEGGQVLSGHPYSHHLRNTWNMIYLRVIASSSVVAYIWFPS